MFQVIEPLLVITIGAFLVTISFVFIGPLPFIPMAKTLPTIITCIVVHAIGFAGILVSGFGMSHREAVAHGFPDGINTYALISGLWLVAIDYSIKTLKLMLVFVQDLHFCFWSIHWPIDRRNFS
jgi:hypothetical protein